MDQNSQLLCAIHDLLRQESPVEVDSSMRSVARRGPTPVRLVGRNANRLEVWIHNHSEDDLYIAAFSGNISTRRFSLKISPNDTLIMNAFKFSQAYKKDVYGFWPQGDGSSKAMITEFFAK